MRQLKLVFNELEKNFRLLFRNWASLSLLVILPLFIIVLVGFAFSSEGLHDVTIGYVSQGEINITAFESNVSNFARLKEYNSTEECVTDIFLHQTQLCLLMEGNFSSVQQTTIPSIKVTFYYDNSQKTLSTSVVESVKEFFGITSQEISLVSAQQMLDQIQNLVYFLDERINEVKQVKNESSAIKQELIERREKLVLVQESFVPKYLAIKDAQKRINDATRDLNQTVLDINEQIGNIKGLDDELDSLFIGIEDVFNATNYTVSYNITDICEDYALNTSLSFNLTGYNNLSELCAVNSTVNLTALQYWSIISSIRNNSVFELDLLMDNFSSDINSTHSSILELKNEFDSIVLNLDEINALLGEEINRSDRYIQVIDESNQNIDELLASLDEKMAKLTNLDPSLAEKLIRPISQQFEEIRPELKNIQITFPLVLATITIFVSMLFSTVVTVMELNNKAYIRDLLAPVNDWIFTVGLAITNFIVVAAQIAVLLVIGQVNFGMPVLENISELLPVICMLILIFVFIGMCFAYIARTTQSAILLSTFMSLAFFLFSDTITPLKAMLPLAAKLAEFNPLYIAHSMIREILLFGLPFNLIIGEFIALTVYAVALLVIVLFAARRRNKIRF